MLILKRIPWISLVLVLLSYSTLGWVLSETKAPLFVWLLLMLTILILVGTLTAPYPEIVSRSSVLFRSNTRTFIVTVFGAFLFFMMLAWFRIFLDSLLIISAAILARIDFQSAGFKQGEVFILTSIFSLVGVALGAAIHIALTQHLFL